MTRRERFADVVESTVERVTALAQPPDLTAGIELDAEDARRVSQAVDDISENGFAVVPDFLDPGRLERIRDEMEPIFAQTGSRRLAAGRRQRPGYGGVQTVHVHNLFAKTRAADGVAIDPVLLKIVEGVLGPLFQLSVGTAMCPDPGVDPQGLHQDDGHYPLPRPRPPFIVNTLIALDDFSRANGATRVVPGSHKQTAPVTQDAGVHYVEMPAGALLAFDGALWHGGGGNTTTSERRRSINLNFNLSWLRQQENQYVGIPRHVWLTLPERLQRLLGFQKVNFLYGSVDYTDPLVYYKAHPDR